MLRQGSAGARAGGAASARTHTVLLAAPALGSRPVLSRPVSCGQSPLGSLLLGAGARGRGCCCRLGWAGQGALVLGALQGEPPAPSHPANPVLRVFPTGAGWQQHGLDFRCDLCEHCLLVCANALETSISEFKIPLAGRLASVGQSFLDQWCC